MAEKQTSREEKMRRGVDTAVETGQRGMQATAEAVRGGVDTAREGARTGLELSRQAVAGTTQQMNQTVQQLTQAAQVYGDTVRRVAEQMRAMMGVPMAGASGWHEVLRAWAEWLSR